jgi:hypothetical protein
MLVTNSHDESHKIKIDFTRKEIKNLQEVLRSFLTQVRLTNNIYYKKECLEMVKKITEVVAW